MPWYRVHQNNSGGVLDVAKGQYLFIKGKDLKQVNEVYEKFVLFKDKYVYCECCGPRWQDEITKDDEVSVLNVLLHYANYSDMGKKSRYMNAKTGKIMKFKEAAETGAFEG